MTQLQMVDETMSDLARSEHSLKLNDSPEKPSQPLPAEVKPAPVVVKPQV